MSGSTYRLKSWNFILFFATKSIPPFWEVGHCERTLTSLRTSLVLLIRWFIFPQTFPNSWYVIKYLTGKSCIHRDSFSRLFSYKKFFIYRLFLFLCVCKHSVQSRIPIIQSGVRIDCFLFTEKSPNKDKIKKQTDYPHSIVRPSNWKRKFVNLCFLEEASCSDILYDSSGREEANIKVAETWAPIEYAAMECTTKTFNEVQGRLITRKISNNIHVITNLTL